ncbi:CopD family protein [Variovorax terrae]|uniref:CopD family protein n=1 Tax=Variovorax terrae TaxID=2923278 RepID=A0A9X1VWP7_9BURK|nr:CopD family protein [Variovorax terrae]MCJ0764608.1 CopD family protein [Variovorax terrae]
MDNLLKLLHLAAAIFWIGGMAFIMLALRPPVAAQLEAPVRLPLMAAVLGRFFIVVWVSIAVLLLTGTLMLAAVGMKAAPAGWHAMLGLGVLMMLIFGHLHASPYRRLKQAVAAHNWPEAGRRLGQVTLLAKINLGLGWLAIAAVLLWK